MNKVLRTADGKYHVVNIASILAFLIAALDIWHPFIPPEYLPYVVAALATLTVAVNVFSASDG